MSTEQTSEQTPAPTPGSFEDAYFAADEAGWVLAERLRLDADAAARAVALEALACVEQTKAVLHTAAFGPDRLDQEGGRDMAVSLAWSARVLRVLAEVQRARAERRARHSVDQEVEQPAADVLDALTDPGLSHDEQARLLSGLYDRLEPLIGVQAAETISGVLDSHLDLAVAGEPR